MADANNVEIQQQLNKLLTDQKRILSANTRSLREQVALTNEMAESLNKANINQDLVQKSQSLKSSLMGAAEEASKFTKGNQDMAAAAAGALKDTDDGFEGLLSTYGKATSKAGAWGAATGGFVSGITKGINILKTGLSGVLSLAGSVVEGMFSIGKAILSIPFKIFNAFVNEANRMRGEPLLAREFEETRKSFGDFGEDLSKHVIGGYRKLRGELAETGLSVFRVLGYRHEQLKFVREQFEALGPLAHQFGQEIASQAEHFAAYQKGLGLSGEMMKGLAQATQATEDSFEDTLRKTTNFTTNLGKRFGISQKVIGRDVGEMTKDLKTFGSVGVRQMGQLSVFARKLGADFKDLLGVVNKFDNFEDAAESAARLAQAFGLNIDAMEMINEQDPAARIEMLRKAFFQTGKDISKLTRQERNYLAATAGIEDQALNSVFALQSQGKTYDEVSAAGQTAEQQQITQAEAMEKLSDSIERMIKSGHRVGGFFDRFVMGFKRGMRWSKDFRQVMRNIRKSLWAAERAGRAVGRAFIKSFPGVKKLLGGMKDFFDPKKFRRMGGKVVSAFKQFFKDLGDPKRAENAMGNLIGALKKAFFGMAGEQHGAMSKIISGFKSMFKAVGQIILSGIKVAMKYMTKFFKAITQVIRGDKSFFEAMKGVFDDGANAGAGFMDDVFFMIEKQLGPVSSKMGDAFMEMMGVAWDKFTDWWKSIEWWEVFKTVISSDAGKALAAVMFGPAFIKMGMNIMGASMSRIIASGGVTKAVGSLGPVFGKVLGAAGPVAAVAAAAVGGWMVGKWLDEQLGLSDKISEWAGEVTGQTAKMNAEILASTTKNSNAIRDNQIENSVKILQKQGSGQKVINALKGEEADRMRDIGKVLKSNLNLSIQERKILIQNLQIEQDRLINDRARAKFKEMTKGKQVRGQGPAKEARKAAIAELKASGQLEMDPDKLGKELVDLTAKTTGLGKKVVEQAKKKAPEITTTDMFFTMDRAETLSPKKMKKLEKGIKEAKGIITKKGGIRDSMDDISKAFEGFDQNKFATTSDSIHSLAEIPSALAAISKARMGGKVIEKSIDGTRVAIKGLAGLAIEVGPIANSAGKDAEKVSKNVQKLTEVPASVVAMAETYNNASSEVSSFANVKDIKNLPIVKGITNLVAASNNIRSQLAGINKVNLKPKVENLGKVLGLKGSDSIKIQHENFKVDISVQVELDPTKLTDAIVDTGRVVRTPKMPRK